MSGILPYPAHRHQHAFQHPAFRDFHPCKAHSKRRRESVEFSRIQGATFAEFLTGDDDFIPWFHITVIVLAIFREAVANTRANNTQTQTFVLFSSR